MVRIHDSVFEGLRAPWQDAVVVKLLRKRVAFPVLKEKPVRMWKLLTGFDMLDNISNGYFMIKFDTKEDRIKVIDKGPWLVFYHHLIVQTWSPEFISPTTKIWKTMVWICFPGLNLYYYDESILLALAVAIGKPIKVDGHMKNVRRGCFARICVEIDLTKPVISRVWLKNF